MKYNFSKKRRVQVYLFITTMLLFISACAFSNFDTYADGNDVILADYYDFNLGEMGFTSSWNSSDYLSSSLANTSYNVNSWSVPAYTNLNDFINYLDGDTSNGEYKLPSSFTIDGITYSLSDFPYFSICNVSSDVDVVLLYPSYSDCLYTRSRRFSSNSALIDSKCIALNVHTNGTYDNIRVASSQSAGSYGTFYLNPNSNLSMYCCNYPICSIDNSKVNTGNADNGFNGGVLDGFDGYYYALLNDQSYYDFGDYSEYFIDNINYLITDSNNGNGYTNPITNENYSELDTEEILNHMTLDDATTKFYLTSDSFNNGTLYMYLGTDEYQQEHITDYSVRIVATSSYSCTKYDNAYRKITYNGKDITQYFPMTSLRLNTYDFYLGTNNQQYYEIPLADFSNNENTLSLSDINKNSHCSSGVDQKLNVLAGALDNTYSGSNFWKQVEQTAFNFGVSNVLTWRFDLNELDMPDFEVVPTSASYHFDLYLYNSELDELSSVQCYGDANLVTGSYDFGNLGTSTEQDKMNALDSDYVPSDYMSTNTNTNYGGTLSNGGSASSSSSPSVSPSISGGDNSINIVNNNTNNGGSGSSSTNESSLGSWSITTLLIKYIAGGKNSGVSYIEDLAGTNTYLSIVSSYMAFVPTEIWSLVITTFTVCLGCVVVAFIISIVIKIIT